MLLRSYSPDEKKLYVANSFRYCPISATEARASSHNGEFDSVVGRADQILFGAQISFRGLDRRVTEKQLDLLKRPACRPAELGTSASQVMRCEARYANCLCVVLEHLPQDLFAQAFTPFARPARVTGRKTWPSASPAADHSPKERLAWRDHEVPASWRRLARSVNPAPAAATASSPPGLQWPSRLSHE